jgi:hypothetical protein
MAQASVPGLMDVCWETPTGGYSLTWIFLPQMGHWYTALPWPSAHTRRIPVSSWFLLHVGIVDSAIFIP